MAEDDLGLDEDDLVQLSLLRDLETDELIEAKLLGEDLRLSSPLDGEVVFRYKEASLHVLVEPAYPIRSVTWDVENYSLPRIVCDGLRARLREIVKGAEATNNISKWRHRDDDNAFGIYKPTMVVLELAKSFSKGIAEAQQPESTLKSKADLPFLAKEIVTSFSSSGAAHRYFGKSPQEICDMVPEGFRILHIEEVLRTNLAQAFEARQGALRKLLLRQSMDTLLPHVPRNFRNGRREDVVEQLVKPRLTWHGTQRQFVPSIVRHGFIIPGTKKPGSTEDHTARCGTTYGVGIYSSPSAEFSLSYSDYSCQQTLPSQFFGLKLLVCATIMGRSREIFRDDNWRNHQAPFPDSDSHMANRGLEYVVFDTAQIIPVYVIHLDWGQDNARHFVDIPDDPAYWMPNARLQRPRSRPAVGVYAGDVQRSKQATFAKASKYFPYGYGPATGGKFVVEAVGEVSEDEEEYGEYQAMRVDEVMDKSKLDFWSWVKAGQEEDFAQKDFAHHQSDEYRSERRGFGPHGLDWDAIPAPRASTEADEFDPSIKREESFSLTKMFG